MNAKRHEPSLRSDQQKSEPPVEPEIGGRQFGQVTEPIQAEMASENDGLTDKQTAQPKESGMKKEKKPRKAA